MMTKTPENAIIYLLSVHDVLHSENFIYNVHGTLMRDKKNHKSSFTNYYFLPNNFIRLFETCVIPFR